MGCIRNEILQKRKKPEQRSSRGEPLTAKFAKKSREGRKELLCDLCGFSLRTLRLRAFGVRGRSRLRRQWIHLAENSHRFQHHAAYNLETLRTQLIDRILRSVPEDIVVAVVEVDEVGAGNAAFDERDVIVGDFIVIAEKMRLISQPRGGLIDHALQPRR